MEFIAGVLEANFMEPAHDKQDFERSSLFIRLEMRLKQMVAEYWYLFFYVICLVSLKRIIAPLRMWY